MVAHEVYGEDAIRVTPPPLPSTTLTPVAPTTILGGGANQGAPVANNNALNSTNSFLLSGGGPDPILNYPPHPTRQMYDQNDFGGNNGEAADTMLAPAQAGAAPGTNVTRVRLVQFQRNTEEPMGITLKLSEEGA